MQVFGAANCNIMVPRAIYVTVLKRPGVAALRSLAARRPPPTASAFAWRLGFCDSPSRGE